MNKLILTSIALVLLALSAHAHSGRTNSEGCHNQTSNNSYHCHNGSSSSSSKSNKQSSRSSSYDRDDYGFDRNSLTYRLSDIGYWSGKPLSECQSVHIDHIVSLSDIHESGGWRLSSAEKRRIANDPANLVATCGAWNRSKSNLKPAAWIKRSSDNNGPKVRWTIEKKCDYFSRYYTFKAVNNLEGMSDYPTEYSMCN